MSFLHYVFQNLATYFPPLLESEVPHENYLAGLLSWYRLKNKEFLLFYCKMTVNSVPQIWDASFSTTRTCLSSSRFLISLKVSLKRWCLSTWQKRPWILKVVGILYKTEKSFTSNNSLSKGVVGSKSLQCSCLYWFCSVDEGKTCLRGCQSCLKLGFFHKYYFSSVSHSVIHKDMCNK